MLKNQSIDSMIFVEAMHLWPRPLDTKHRQFVEAEAAVEECRQGRQHARVHRVPEIVDFRFPGPSVAKLLNSATVSADADGKLGCSIGDAATASVCSHCSPERHVLCRCAQQLTRRDRLQRCCKAGMEQLRRKAATAAAAARCAPR